MAYAAQFLEFVVIVVSVLDSHVITQSSINLASCRFICMLLFLKFGLNDLLQIVLTVQLGLASDLCLVARLLVVQEAFDFRVLDLIVDLVRNQSLQPRYSSNGFFNRWLQIVVRTAAFVLDVRQRRKLLEILGLFLRDGRRGFFKFVVAQLR